jgi:hypothetical protein
MLSVRDSVILLFVSSVAAGCATQTGGRLNPPATSDEIFSLSLMHGLSAITSAGDASDPTARPTCTGSGVDQAHAVQMSSIHGKGQIEDVQPCLRLLYPDGRSNMQSFVIKDNRYYTVARLEDASGGSRDVFFDITQWAEDAVAERRAYKP